MTTRRRRAGSRIAAALGDSLSNVSSLIMKNMMQDRIDARGQSNALALLGRQREDNLDTLFNSVLQKAAAGDLTSDQVGALFAAGHRPAPSNLESIVPSTRRRLETTAGKAIMDAKAPEDVPTNEDLASIARAQGAVQRPPIPPGMLLESDDPFVGLDPAVADLGFRATARRNQLMSKPTDLITVTNPDLSTSSVAASRYRMPEGGLPTGPSAVERGQSEGYQQVAKLNTAGAAEANQAGAVAGATESAKMAPALVSARVGEAGRTAGARSAAELPYQIQLATARARADAQASLDGEHMKATALSSRAAADLMPFVERFSQLVDRVNTSDSGIKARAGGLMREGMAFMGMDPDVAEMDQLINQNLRKLAQAMGVREANVSEGETKQALAGLGVKATSTRTEAMNSLRNLQDLSTVAPVVAARTSAETPIADRLALAKQLIDSRRGAEENAVKAYNALPDGQRPAQLLYLDPVTGGMLRVYR